MDLDYTPLNENKPKMINSDLTDLYLHKNKKAALILLTVIFLFMILVNIKYILLIPIILFFIYSLFTKGQFSVIRLSNFAVVNGFRFKSINKNGKGISGLHLKGVLGVNDQKITAVNQIIGKYKDFDFKIFSVFNKGNYTIMEVQLKNMYPHIVLDSKFNDLFFNGIGSFFENDSRIHLEGDFDNYFKAYAKASAIDTLRILSPDMMGMMIDSGYQYDIEIVEDRLHIISNYNFTNEVSVRSFFKIADILLNKLDRRKATVQAEFDSTTRVK